MTESREGTTTWLLLADSLVLPSKSDKLAGIDATTFSSFQVLLFPERQSLVPSYLAYLNGNNQFGLTFRGKQASSLALGIHPILS